MTDERNRRDAKGAKAKSNSADDLIQQALASVERIEKESRATDGELNVDAVEVLPPSEQPPSGDPSQEGAAEVSEEGEILEIDDGPAPKAASDAMLQAYIDAKNEAVAALEQTQKEAQTFRERLQRVSADFDNFKKRQVRERAEAVKFANESLLKEFMPVLDNMERAVAAARQTEIQDEGARKMLEGVDMVLRQFEETLAKAGIKPFGAMGEKFDPAKHEAVGQREDPSVPAQTVIEEYQRGYMIHDRLARPAMVMVSTGGPKAAAQPESNAASADADAGSAED